jgi:predicted transposase YbfD/YdcC
MVTAFDARQQLVLRNVKVPETPSTITAISKELAILAVEGSIATINACGATICVRKCVNQDEKL